MKKLLFIYLAFGLSVAVSQNKQLLYNWEVTPQTLMLNPGALVTNQFHAGIPLASQFHINVGSSGVSVFEILVLMSTPSSAKTSNTETPEEPTFI